MTCKDAIDILADYLDATLGAELARELKRHLSGCAPCQAYLITYRRTAELGREAGRVEMPPEMKRRLREFLAKRLGSDPARPNPRRARADFSGGGPGPLSWRQAVGERGHPKRPYFEFDRPEDRQVPKVSFPGRA